MGGNFYGPYCFCHGWIEGGAGSVADMCDRQNDLLVNPHLSRGLPGDFVRLSGKRSVRHGFKAMSISSIGSDGRRLERNNARGNRFAFYGITYQTRSVWGQLQQGMLKGICTLTERVLSIHLWQQPRPAIFGKCEIRPYWPRLKRKFA